eukprot:scaffold5036_cov155-Pinguiococcus_pyrenoidosus.AAC.2
MNGVVGSCAGLLKNTHCWHSDIFLCSTSSLTNQRTRAHHSSNPTNEITHNWEFTYSQPIGSIP